LWLAVALRAVTSFVVRPDVRLDAVAGLAAKNAILIFELARQAEEAGSIRARLLSMRRATG
jgi:hypothetical protein